MTTPAPLIVVENVSKRFGGTQALNDVSFGVTAGEIHAVVGENGAGKSTLMNILSGVIPQDTGHIYLNGVEIRNATPRKIQALGVATVYQELNLLPNRDAAQNIFAGSEPRKRGVLVDRPLMQRRARELLRRLGVDPMPAGPVGTLPIATQQLIEIARVLLRDARVVVMDEPNSALTDRETECLFDVILDLKARGITLLYISHRIDEVLRLADRITILRDGRYVTTLQASEADVRSVASLMVGRTIDRMFPAKEDRVVGDEIIFQADGLSKSRAFEDVSFTVRNREILGVFGLEGSGRTEIAEALWGVTRPDRGEIRLNGRPVTIDSPHSGIRMGLAYVPPDRKREGLILNRSVGFNIALSILRSLGRGGVLTNGAINHLAGAYAEQLNIRCSSMAQQVVNLSGGNQQKVVLARGLAVQPRVLILNEPTRGIDVGAKQEIYKLVLELAARGMSIIFISSELPEIMALCDRVLVVYAGRLTAEVIPSRTTRDEVLSLACGSSGDTGRAVS